MKHSRILQFVILSIFFISSNVLISQIEPGVYLTEKENEIHELKINSSYFVHSVYEKSPARFIKTAGGFYTTENGTLKVELEFHSNYKLDSLTTLNFPYKIENEDLIIQGNNEISFKKQPNTDQDLDGAWLFGTRGPDEGQKRRGETNTRKTLKFLIDGRFQWIAYDTEGMQFKGTGGGSYTSKDGIYTENIEFFSKDNSRVG
ncbi:MAG: hypothetical protein AB8B59_17185, partial [Maribacter sp.]